MEAFFSALKRKQLKDTAVEALTLLGHTEAATELQSAGRLTDAAIERTIKLTRGDVVETPETPETPIDEDDIQDEDALNIGQIEQLVADGKVKKAKKAFKAQFSKDHPNYKALKKLIKAAK